VNIQSVTVAFSVSDLEKAILWYKRAFGIRKAVRPVQGIAEMQLGPVWLQLFEREKIPSDAALRLGVPDVEKERRRLVKMGHQVEEITDVPGVLRYFDFQDPDGNGLTLYTLYE